MTLILRVRPWRARRSRRAAVLLLAAALADPTPTFALAPTGSSRWYYHIGGADAVLPALNRGATSVRLGGSIDLGLGGLNCNGFDFGANISHALDGAVDKVEALITEAGQNLISALPGLIIQRASPSLYELYQEVASYAEAAISLATKSCEQMQSDMAAGRNPFDGWLTASMEYNMKNKAGDNASGTRTIDVISAVRDVQADGGKKGVPWVDGQKAGGDGASHQPPIRVVTDVVTAGYNLTLGKSMDLLNTGKAPQDTDTRLGQVFKTPKEAADWAVDVLGDIEIKSGAPGATPGHGLGPKIEKDRDAMTEALAKLVSGATKPSPAELAKVSAPGTGLTREVLEAIRKLPAADQAVAIGKLAGEAATAANVEKALMVRRLLLSGFQEPHVYASPAGQDIQRLVGVIDREIDQLLYETRIRRELFAATAGTLLDVGRSLDARAAPAYRPGDSKPVEDSGVKP